MGQQRSTALGPVLAIGLTLAVGVLAGFVISRATRSPAAAGEGGSPATVTVAAFETPPPVTVLATVTVEPEPNDDPAGPKASGNYLVGSELAAGTWQCSEGNDLTSWFARDQAGQVTADWGAGTLAVIPDNAYIADLLNCDGTWSRVG